jgi:hypothetical protein
MEFTENVEFDPKLKMIVSEISFICITSVKLPTSSGESPEVM